ncbi:MAG: hypothetical protein HWQ41_12510 [Nostoc sp. NOS(2021)]|uniref:hypothetical protein n=1 Tax=Nostoc sp. NOS(2021) TaxID=2815407 RepID=UPI0025D2E349|nr:hypothetical protein [Nostoc sp. NOS(2021)]MBN3896049.1 hypothetical protein [Nostoc sp. NOS(2021)]
MLNLQLLEQKAHEKQAHSAVFRPSPLGRRHGDTSKERRKSLYSRWLMNAPLGASRREAPKGAFFQRTQPLTDYIVQDTVLLLLASERVHLNH